MDLIKDFLLVNKSTIKKSTKSLGKNWMLVFTGLVYTILNILLLIILNTFFRGPLYILVGFIMAIVSSSLISNYLLIIKYIKLCRTTMGNFKEGFGTLWKVYGVSLLRGLLIIYYP